MSVFDPYAAPAAASGGETAGDVPRGAVAALRGTRPWVRLFSILGFVGAALMVVVGSLVLLGGGASMFGELGTDGAAMIGVGAAYLLIGVLYLLPCLFLFRYASHITRVIAGGGSAALVEALDQQRRFWRLVGIYALVTLALYAVVLVVVAITVAVGAFAG